MDGRESNGSSLHQHSNYDPELSSPDTPQPENPQASLLFLTWLTFKPTGMSHPTYCISLAFGQPNPVVSTAPLGRKEEGSRVGSISQFLNNLQPSIFNCVLLCTRGKNMSQHSFSSSLLLSNPPQAQVKFCRSNEWRKNGIRSPISISICFAPSSDVSRWKSAKFGNQQGSRSNWHLGNHVHANAIQQANIWSSHYTGLILSAGRPKPISIFAQEGGCRNPVFFVGRAQPQ